LQTESKFGVLAINITSLLAPSSIITNDFGTRSALTGVTVRMETNNEKTKNLYIKLTFQIKLELLIVSDFGRLKIMTI
jgi:hypothetical protein